MKSLVAFVWWFTRLWLLEVAPAGSIRVVAHLGGEWQILRLPTVHGYRTFLNSPNGRYSWPWAKHTLPPGQERMERQFFFQQ